MQFSINENKIRKKQKSVYKRNDYKIKGYWKEGYPLTSEDKKMLEEVQLFFDRKGYIPSKKEISNATDLKGRFRTWGEVLKAAGLPDIHDGEEVRKRQQAAMDAKQSKEESNDDNRTDPETDKTSE